jgi:MerR family transcriptional regulator, heat shock protein HspR
MTKEFWTVKEVLEVFEIDERFLSDLEEEELICPLCGDQSPVKGFSA